MARGPRGAAALRDLSAAADGFSGTTTSGGRPPRLVRLFPLFAAAIIGAILAFAIPAAHLCTAEFRLIGEPSRQRLAYYRTELTIQAGRRLGTSQPGTREATWRVEHHAPRTIELTVRTPGRQAGLAAAQQVAASYEAALDASATALRTTPSAAEVAWSERGSELQDRLAEFEDQLARSATALPEIDPTEAHADLLAQWNALKSSFGTSRERLDEVAAKAAELQSSPEPTFGVVSSRERNDALQADLALQQDLRELTVELTELKLHLLNVWQKSGSLLEALRPSCDDFAAAASPSGGTSFEGLPGDTLNALAADISEYSDLLAAFVQAWTKEFTTLRQIEVDPLAGELLDAHTRARSLLNDFLFNAGKRLTAMRARTRRLGETTSNLTRFHVFFSNLTRGFHAFERCHHRFEFTAGAVDPAHNFRLDAALQGARGLRRRSQLRIRRIDERLQELAVQDARKQRTSELTEAERFIRELRTRSDETVAELVAMQTKLNLTAVDSQEFLRAMLQRDLAKTQIERLRKDLADTEEQRQRLSKHRHHEADASHIELVSCSARLDPGVLGRRFRIGGVGAILTLLAVGFGQWLITRRR